MKLSVSRNTLIFLLALVVGGGATLAVHRYLKARVADIDAQAQGPDRVKVLVAKAALDRGAALTAETVAVREIPAQWAHSDALRPEQFDEVENQLLAVPARPGEPLHRAQLEPARPPSFAARLTEGLRAVTVPVDEVNSVSGMIAPGDRIDLVAVIKGEGQPLLLNLLQDASVLATGTRVSQEDPEDPQRHSYTTITLETTPHQARQVLAAREMGKLAAILRPGGDALRGPTVPIAAAHLLGLHSTASAPTEVVVPVLYGNDLALREPRRLPANGGRP